MDVCEEPWHGGVVQRHDENVLSKVTAALDFDTHVLVLELQHLGLLNDFMT